MNKQKITATQRTGNELDVYCNLCQAKTKHVILSGLDIDNIFIDYHNNYEKIETHRYDYYYILQCGGCKNIVFRKSSIDSEDISFGVAEEPLIEIYPKPYERSNKIDNIPYIDEEIKSIYRETILSYNYQLPILTAIGVRAIIEAICDEQDIEGNNLFEKIQNFVNNDILSPTQRDTLNKLKNIGNDAVHDRKIHNNEQLKLTLDIVDNLLENIYIIPHRVKKHID